MEHSERHEEILQRILTGDLDPEGDEARQQLEACADCRRELEGMRALLSELDAAGAFERSVLEEASELADAPGLGDVERVLKAEMSGAQVDLEAPILAGPRPAARARLVTWAAVIAAAIIGVVLLQGLLGTNTNDRSTEQTMGTEGIEGIELVRPLQPGDGFGTFEWNYDLPPGMTFEVVVHDADPEARTEPLHRESDLTENRWTPDEKLTAEWRSICWYVEVIDESGELDNMAQSATVDSP